MAFQASGQMDDFNWGESQYAGNSTGIRLTGDKYQFSLTHNANYFYHTAWHEGTLTTRDRETQPVAGLRYDAFNDEVVVYNEHVKGLFVIDKYAVTGFSVMVPGAGLQTFRKMLVGATGTSERFLEVIYEGNVTLYRSNRIFRRKTALYRNKLGELDNQVFDLVQVYFIGENDQQVKRINPGRKSVLSLFPDQKKQVRRLLRSYQISDYSLNGVPAIVKILDEKGYF
jgi:hypothetical protein